MVPGMSQIVKGSNYISQYYKIKKDYEHLQMIAIIDV